MDLHVVANSAAGGDGSLKAPFSTLQEARDAVRKLSNKAATTIIVGDGEYYLKEPLILKPEDSGSARAPITWRAEHEGKAVISGGTRLQVNWQPYKDGIYMAETPPNLAIDQLFIDSNNQRMARYPNYDPAKKTVAYQGCSADAFSKERATRWSDPTGGYIHAMHPSLWGGYHYRITGKKPDGNVAYEGGWQNNRQAGMHPSQRMVENIFEELDAPGEWYHNSNTHTLYYMPEPGQDLSKAKVEIVLLRNLIEFQGSLQTPVRLVQFQGFVFRHAARTFMDTKEPLLRSDWTIYRGGAVTLTGTEDVRFTDCEFDQVGGHAVFANKYNRRILIKGCHIHDTGACGVAFVGDPKAVRNPLFEYGQRQNFDTIDRTPGPQTPDYPADCVVDDCLIHNIGRTERQASAVQISMSSGITIRDASIYDCNRAGINISEGTWGGHLVDRCDVFDTVLETGDHGSFNSWGRDRYWNSDHRDSSQKAVDADPKLPFLDAQKPNILRNSRWRCDHGWDIDLDDGSSNYQIYNNLLLQGGLKFREGFRRKAWNNVMVNNGFHPHVWYDHSDSQFTNNIVMHAHAPIGMPEGWTKMVDRNFFTSEADRKQFVKDGADIHSLSGDPMFIDAAKGDFRVKDGSPALKIGFKNFPMDQFGVKKPSLKTIARTPVIPNMEVRPSSVAESNVEYWLGVELHGIIGEEFSAFGTRREDGGVQLTEIAPGSLAQKAGLQSNDLIQSVNGKKVTNTKDFLMALADIGDAPLDLMIVRFQKNKNLKISNLPYIQTESTVDTHSWKALKVPTIAAGTAQANHEPDNEAVTTLTDGEIAGNYGPVFANGVQNGAYRLDLGNVRQVSSITAWTYNQNDNRGAQRWTAYGSASETDPGWDTSKVDAFTPLITIDSTRLPKSAFQAVSWRTREGQSFGRFRWIVWKVSPVTSSAENSAFQEISAQ